jgi:Gluconate 2-dehydrogenase subunit 3
VEKIERRAFMKGAAVGALAFIVGGTEVFLTTREARAQDGPFKVLSVDERAALETLGETLLPGAKDAGIAHHVDQQLSVEPSECLLVASSLGVIPPYAGFYRTGLAGLDEASLKVHGVKFAALAADKRHEFVDQLRQRDPHGWTGPAFPFFLFCDAERRGGRVLRNRRGA